MMDMFTRSGIFLLLVAIWSSLFAFGVYAEAGAEPTFAAVKMASGDEVRCPFFEIDHPEPLLTARVLVDRPLEWLYSSSRV